MFYMSEARRKSVSNGAQHSLEVFRALWGRSLLATPRVEEEVLEPPVLHRILRPRPLLLWPLPQQPSVNIQHSSNVARG